jgi:nitrogen fixation protein NifZ
MKERSMIEPRLPKFDQGQPVLAGTDLFNDGSYPDRELDVLLVGQGTAGEVVQVGLHTESQTPVYMVEFKGGCVVGCLEEELQPR